MIPQFLETILDALTLAIWTGISIFFVRRFLRHHKLVSLMIAFMAFGWATLGWTTIALYVLRPVLLHMCLHWFNVIAIALGLAVWYSIWRVERHGK